MAAEPAPQRRFTVALSFPGEHRDFIADVAAILVAKLEGEAKVLYDKFHDAEFARLDLDVYLPNLYRTQSELIVIFLCPAYEQKRWCKLEWRHIRQLIATADADRIMFLSIGDPGDVSGIGILSGDGYIDIASMTPEEVAAKILKRLSVNNIPITQKKSDSSISADISRIVEYAPTDLVGREAEIKILSDAWQKTVNGEKEHPHILTFVALGGEGKTSLVTQWAADLAAQEWSGVETAFAWSFYSQGTREQQAASSDLFLKEALVFFGDPETAGGAEGPYEKGRRLARLVGAKRSLLILDGLEPLQYAPMSPTAGELKDEGIAALLKGLAATSKGLCIVTTRYSIPNLRAFWKSSAPEHKLLSLTTEAGVDLLQKLGVRGPKRELEELVKEVNGHALTLNLIGSYLRDAHAGDIRKRDLIDLSEADEEEQGGHALRVMDAYVRWFEEDEGGRKGLALLQLVGLFDRPARMDCIQALLKPPAIVKLTELLIDLSEAQRNVVLSRLEAAKLLTVNRDLNGEVLSLDAHPLLREYFAKRLREESSETWKAAHKRLFEYLAASTADKPKPTLEDLQPLYQAIAHGCLADLHQIACDDVYVRRIFQGTEKGAGFYTMKLGAFGSDLGAISSFFDEPWTHVSLHLKERSRGWVLGVAAYCLQALGRLNEVLEPVRSSLTIAKEFTDWQNASVASGNLARLELALGEIADAITDATQSVDYANLSGIWFQRISRMSGLAEALHQFARYEEAKAINREAEAIQLESQPTFPLLYAVQGFRYCDLLLGAAERAAWQATLDANPVTKDKQVDAVERRARRTMQWANAHLGPFEVALDNLTLARISLYRVLLGEKSRCGECVSHLRIAIDDLRRAGQQDNVPLGLLTRGWYRAVTGALTGPDSAQEDLNEAWEIAERGPMRLHMADIHLYRARLFHAVEPYPWNTDIDGNPRGPKDDLRDARELIERCGYWRRKEELEDAEEAAKGWPD